jgi:D-amino-acid dehydrogenase
MNVIVLGGGVFGVTTAYYVLKGGHEATQIERQPGAARECSHANGGLVAISQAATWSAGRAVQNLQDHGAARRV